MTQELKRKYQKHMLITSMIITVAIFFAGMLFGIGLDKYRIKEVTNILNQNELDMQSYITEQMFFENLDTNECELIKTSIISLTKTISNIGRKLELYGSKTTFENSEFDYLKRKYFISEIRLYNHITSYRKDCGANYDVLLYFYKIDDELSIRQGYILDDLFLERNNDMTTLSFDIEYKEEPLLDIIKQKYNITQSPAIIINGDKTFQGKIINKYEIKEYLNN
ncbi:MAG: thioredoxin family protein [DPANN group archaeon]|nr:thioredoxin family protein [DPANN group archaeon]